MRKFWDAAGNMYLLNNGVLVMFDAAGNRTVVAEGAEAESLYQQKLAGSGTAPNPAAPATTPSEAAPVYPSPSLEAVSMAAEAVAEVTEAAAEEYGAQ